MLSAMDNAQVLDLMGLEDWALKQSFEKGLISK